MNPFEKTNSYKFATHHSRIKALIDRIGQDECLDVTLSPEEFRAICAVDDLLDELYENRFMSPRLKMISGGTI